MRPRLLATLGIAVCAAPVGAEDDVPNEDEAPEGVYGEMDDEVFRQPAEQLEVGVFPVVERIAPLRRRVKEEVVESLQIGDERLEQVQACGECGPRFEPLFNGHWDRDGVDRLSVPDGHYAPFSASSSAISSPSLNGTAFDIAASMSANSSAVPCGINAMTLA